MRENVELKRIKCVLGKREKNIMSDSILSVRVSEEFKQKFIDMAQSTGVNNKEFLQSVIKAYEVNKSVEGDTFFYSDIEEMQMLTCRMNELYLNIVDKTRLREKEKEGRIKETVEEKDRIITESQEESKKLLEKIEKIEYVKSENDRIKKDLKRIKEDNESLRSLNSLLKEKNNSLSEKLHMNEEKIKKYDSLEKEVKEFNHLNGDLRKKIEMEELKLESKVIEFERFQKDLNEKLDNQKDMYDRKIELLVERKEIDIEREKMKLKEVMINEFEKQKNQFEKKIEALVNEKENRMMKISNLEQEIMKLEFQFKENVTNKE